MAFPFNFLLLLLLSYLSVLPFTEPKLSLNYYDKSCPKFQQILERVITDKQISAPSTAAATLRLLFHDCMVDGCDASILISSNAFNKAERDTDINLTLAGDGFDLITRAKTALELECPNIVSCADILITATRDLITMVGGPNYPVHLGRKDSFVSKAKHVNGNIVRPTMPLSQIISIFNSKKLSIQEMVALVGAHTIGFSHCKEFSHKIYNFNKTSAYDPSYNPKYAEGLRKLCANYTKDPAMAAFNDVRTPNKFDNMYFQNLQKGLGLLESDHALATDERTKPYVDMYAANQNKFFQDFAKAMEKFSIYNVKTGRKGEVRHRCDAFNSIAT